MGIPYSREINHAFKELNKAYGKVTPLVAAAYEVLETTKNISLLLAGIQVLTVLLLALILLALVGLLITMNPDLEDERTEFVTPIVKWLAGWADVGRVGVGAAMGFALLIAGAAGVVVYTTHQRKLRRVERLENGEENEDSDSDEKDEEDEKKK